MLRSLAVAASLSLTLLGMGIGWGTQQRDDTGTSFWDAVRFHGGGTLLALAWGALLFELNRVFFWWSSPLVFSLLLSVPVSMISSRAEIGRFFRTLRIFVTPEETRTTLEYNDIDRYLEENAAKMSSFGLPPEEGFARAAVDPGLNLLHRSLLRGQRSLDPAIATRRDALLDKAVTGGYACLSKKEKKELLYDPERIVRLHEQIWTLPSEDMEARWGLRIS